MAVSVLLLQTSQDQYFRSFLARILSQAERVLGGTAWDFRTQKPGTAP